MKSMTGYGHASQETFFGRIILEITSVNRKYLDVNVQLPKEWLRFEGEIRKRITATNRRGQITVKIDAFFETDTSLVVKPNLSLARQIKHAWEVIVEELYPQTSLPIDLTLLNHEDILSFARDEKNEEQIRNSLFEALESALKPFEQMKASEGAVLKLDIAKKFQNIEQNVDTISQYAPQATERYRRKLMERLNEIITGNVIQNEQRILLEVGIFAEKVDITEEITRLRSHLDQANRLLDTEDSLGKTLEFLLQEMNREVNTIGSKATDIEVTRRVIECKNELEKIREQVQNIE